MDLVFNEISLNNKAENKQQAISVLSNLAKTCKSLKEVGFNKLRAESDFWTKVYFEDFILSNFIQQIPSKTQSSFLRSFIRPPYLADEFISEADEKFAENNYFFDGDIKITGLAYAYLLDTICVSLLTDEIWNNAEIEITEQYNNTSKDIVVKNASKPAHANFHKNWIDDNRPVQLIKTTQNPNDKKINLRHDHGKDKLLEFSKRIVKSEFVLSVVNSLPFNPNERNFIRKSYPNGQIEIVLTDSDEGFGIIIQTTGRTSKETEEIGKILKEKYE